MKQIAKVITMIFLLLIVGTNVMAKDYRVVTFYFAGTGATINWWNSDISVDFELVFWKSLGSYWNKPELLATLHRHHKGLSPYTGYNYSTADATVVAPGSGNRLIHEKYFFDGIGTIGPSCIVGTILNNTCGRKLDRENPGRPGAVRGWKQINDQAWSQLGYILDVSTEDIILNVVGWSSGGVSAIRFANEVARNQKPFYTRVKKINILAFDPVPGWDARDYVLNCDIDATLLEPSHFDFTGLAKVNQYVGIYAWDERSTSFSPILPLSIDNSIVFSLPGSHETMMGNTMDLGHSVVGVWDPAFWGWLWPPPSQSTIEKISYVSDFSAVIVMKLLGSPEWGEQSLIKHKNRSFLMRMNLTGMIMCLSSMISWVEKVFGTCLWDHPGGIPNFH